jgi:aspartoacylase
LDARQILATHSLVQASLDFIELLNAKADVDLADSVPLYQFVKHVDYPRSHDGFPSFFIHPDLQDKDFCELSKGSPIFMDLNGHVVTWQEDAVWPVFINEAAYYEKGIAFTATQRTEITASDIRGMQSL